MKHAVFAVALIAACSPAPPSTQSKPETPAVQTAPAPTQAPAPAPNAAALAATPAEGQWFFADDNGFISANFGPPESEALLSIVCHAADHRISLYYGGELRPDQDTTMRILTAAQSLDIPARSNNDELSMISADIDTNAPLHGALFDALTSQQQRFAITGAGDTIVLPWDQSIPRALAGCR